jgi:hypothetical protein
MPSGPVGDQGGAGNQPIVVLGRLSSGPVEGLYSWFKTLQGGLAMETARWILDSVTELATLLVGAGMLLSVALL